MASDVIVPSYARSACPAVLCRGKITDAIQSATASTAATAVAVKRYFSSNSRSVLAYNCRHTYVRVNIDIVGQELC